MKISELFYVKYGINLELVNCEIVNKNNKDGINFVARAADNNGVVARVKPIEGKIPQSAGVLTCAGGGSVLSTFLQTEPFYSGRDLYILTPKNEMTINEKLFYCMCIKNNAYRYNYGRQANRTMSDIDLPETVPEWVNSMTVTPIKTEIKATVQSLNVSEWKEFQVGGEDGLFHVERGTRITKENRSTGKIPLVTAGFSNEGIAELIYTDKNKLYSNSLTIDMFGNCFYRNYKFYCDDNILILKCKTHINKYAYLFISTIISEDNYRYSYGRQYRQKDVHKHIIKLPIKSNGSPDWDYMELYIKSLPYSDKI